MIRITNATKELIFIAIDFDWKRVDRIRKIKGREWHPRLKMWSIPNNKESICLFAELFNDENIEIVSTRLPGLKDFFRELNKTWIIALLDDLKTKLKLKGYSHKTCKAYVNSY